MLSYINAASGLIISLVNVMLQVLICRYSNAGLLKSIFISFFTGICILLFSQLYLFNQGFLPGVESFSYFITNLIIYSALGYCYFHFLNLGVTARRIRVLIELYNSRGGLSMDEILKHYNAREIFVNRIKRLINSGQLAYREGRYYINKPTMLLIAKAILIMKLIITGKKSEFE